jgi:hypothetical protein
VNIDLNFFRPSDVGEVEIERWENDGTKGVRLVVAGEWHADDTRDQTTLHFFDDAIEPFIAKLRAAVEKDKGKQTERELSEVMR